MNSITNPDTTRLRYKPDLFIGKVVPVEMPAGDWLSFMTWVTTVDAMPISDLITVYFRPQIIVALYDAESIKSVEATISHQADNSPMARIARGLSPFPMPGEDEFPHE